MARLEFSGPAARELEAIFSYTLERWGPAQAQAYLTELEQTCLKLARSPQMGAPDPTDGARYRRFLSGRHWLYYLPIKDGVRIMAVMHARRQPRP